MEFTGLKFRSFMVALRLPRLLRSEIRDLQRSIWILVQRLVTLRSTFRDRPRLLNGARSAGLRLLGRIFLYVDGRCGASCFGGFRIPGSSR